MLIFHSLNVCPTSQSWYILYYTSIFLTRRQSCLCVANKAHVYFKASSIWQCESIVNISCQDYDMTLISAFSDILSL